MAHAGGRPTKYDPSYCQRLIDLYNAPSTEKRTRTIHLKNGTEITEEYDAPVKPVHVIDFCDEIGVDITTFYEWCKVHKEFSHAYAHAKGYLERNVVDNALLNNYNGGFASLVSKNWFGWRDKQDVESKVDTTLTINTIDYTDANDNDTTQV